MAEKQKVDLSTLPKGLTKEEFTALPNFKKIRAFFTWAGVVSIVSGIFILSSIGHISQSILQNGGSLDGLFQMGTVKLNLLFMVVSSGSAADPVLSGQYFFELATKSCPP